MRPRGLSRSSPSTWYVGHVAVQKPQCTHLRRIDCASSPSGVWRMKSASSVCMASYTFPVKLLAWLLLIASMASFVYGVARWRKRLQEQERASEARFATLLAQVKPAAPSAAPAAASAPAIAREERLLLDAAGNAGEAGEPVLAIQLYAKLLSRYPQSSLAAQARAAVAELKKKLAQG